MGDHYVDNLIERIDQHLAKLPPGLKSEHEDIVWFLREARRKLFEIGEAGDLISRAAELIKTSGDPKLSEVRGELNAEDVLWIVNDMGELGVRIGDQCFFLYKGNSLVYDEHDDGSRIKIRTVGKREFGETCQKLNWEDISLAAQNGYNIRIGTVSVDDCDRWEDMPRQDHG